MAEYIEREALLADLRGSYEELRNIYNGLHYDEERQICSAELASFMECIMRVKEAPTADAVEVVRCKDCQCFELMTSTNQHFCNQFGGYVTESDYCSRHRNCHCAKMDGKGEGE
jgi:hypothetical protein